MHQKTRSILLLLAAGALACAVAMSSARRPAHAAPADDPVLVGAGDISSCANDNDEATAALLDGIGGSVFTLGDNVYENGTGAEFTACYDPTWGRHKLRTHPTSGNHEYNSAGAAPYYAYFGAAAGDPSSGYYSYDAGSFWHVIVLNSECDAIGGCDAGTPQETWLRADLASNASKNVLAMMHKPRFSSGTNVTTTQALWDALYAAGADVVLSGHDHDYERFAPQTAAGVADGTYGIREFVVGTGGRSLATFGTIKPNSELHDNNTYGVLKLTLHQSSYDWQFVPVAGQTFTDSGTAPVHGPPPPPTPTPAPTATATAAPTSTAGPTSVFGITTSGGANDSSDSAYINGSRFSLTTAGALSSLSLFVGSTPANAHVRLALYSNDAAGNPLALLAQTSPAIAVSGWNTLPVAAGPTLAAGTYWIVAQTDNAATVYRVASGLSASNFVGWAPFAYGAFPNGISGWAKFGSQSFDMYGTVGLGAAPTATASTVPSATASRTPTATATAVPTATSTSVPTATSTGTSTSTSVPTTTSTPTATNTALPTATSSASATSTMAPTSTTVPTATSTPAPSATTTSTSTPTRTNTAVPTVTSTPTNTPRPTASPAATNTPQPVVLFGLTTNAGANDSSDFGYANGSPFPLSTGGTLTALSVYVGATPAGAHLRLALYTNDASGNPGALRAQTGEATAVVGWNTVSVPGGVTLAGGTYWIVAQTDNVGTVYRIATGLSASNYEGYGSLPYGTFPATVGGWSKIARRAFDLYGSVSTVATPTPTP